MCFFRATRENFIRKIYIIRFNNERKMGARARNLNWDREGEGDAIGNGQTIYAARDALSHTHTHSHTRKWRFGQSILCACVCAKYSPTNSNKYTYVRIKHALSCPNALSWPLAPNTKLRKMSCPIKSTRNVQILIR